MAEHADGSIIVDTEIDGTGFEADSKKLQSSIKRLDSKMQSLGTTFQKAISGNARSLTSFNANADMLERTISEIETDMESLASKSVFTDDYQQDVAMLEKANQKLAELDNRQSKMKALDVEESSQSCKKLQYDIDLTKTKIQDIESDMDAMNNKGLAFQSGSSTAQYVQLESALSAATNRLAQMRSEIASASSQVNNLFSVMRNAPSLTERLSGSLSKIVNGARSVGSAFGSMGSSIKNAATHPLQSLNKGIGSVMSGLGHVAKKGASAFLKVGSAIKNGASKMLNFKKSSGGAEGAIGKLGKKLTSLGSMMKRMVLAKIMQGIIKSVKDGFNNLSQYSSQTNSDLSALKSGLTQLKNSFATAFAPILTAVTPILTKFIGYISSALTYVGKFIAALTGAKTFTKASAVQEDYAASLNSTSEAAKDAKKQLAGFDEINMLNDNTSSSDSGSGSASPSEMFEEVPIESSITNFTDSLKEAFENGDYAGIGEILGNGINSIFQKANKLISWDNVGNKIISVITGIAQGFNSLVDTIDWELIGDTVAQGLNTLLNTIYLLITEFDWPGLAAGVSRGFNGLVAAFDWGNLGTAWSDGVRTVLATLSSAITTFDWHSLGSGISSAINNIDWVDMLSEAAGLLSDGLIALFDLIIGFADNLDWGKLGRDIWDGFIGIITGIDWGGIISKAFHLLGSAVGGCAALILNFCITMWNSIKQGFESVKAKYFEKYMNNLGELTIEGFFQGIEDMLSDIGKWIKENMWDPFVEGFKNAFGIHSPSTKMAEMGNYIVEGFLNGITGIWNTVTDFFSTSFDDIKNTISRTWESVKAETSTKWQSIKTTLSASWDSLKTNASTKWSELKSTISTKWNEIKNNSFTQWDTIKTALSTKWDGIKSTASTKWDSIKNTIKNKGWSKVGADICNGISSGIDSGWKWLKEKVGSVATSLLDKAKSALGIHSPSKLFRDIVGLNIGYGIGEGIEASEGSVIKTVAGLANAIATEANAGDYCIGGSFSTGEIDGALTDFSDKVANSFSTLLDRLQAIADGVTFTVPTVATGTILPYSVSNNNTTSTAKTVTTDNIQSHLSSIDKSFTEMKQLLRAQSNGNHVYKLYLDGKEIYTSSKSQASKFNFATNGGVL